MEFGENDPLTRKVKANIALQAPYRFLSELIHHRSSLLVRVPQTRIGSAATWQITEKPIKVASDRS
jgi:hypothetical protein